MIGALIKTPATLTTASTPAAADSTAEATVVGAAMVEAAAAATDGISRPSATLLGSVGLHAAARRLESYHGHSSPRPAIP